MPVKNHNRIKIVHVIPGALLTYLSLYETSCVAQDDGLASDHRCRLCLLNLQYMT